MAKSDRMLMSSILDTDLYKLTMQQAVLQHYPTSIVSYRFTNRGGNRFSRKCYESVLSSVADLAKISITTEEMEWLKGKCSFFSSSYLEYLSTFRFKPADQVKIEYIVEEIDSNTGLEWGRFEIVIKGNWAETILYEVPIMAILSETYFAIDDMSWDYQGQFANAKAKGKELIQAGCILSEFGTRRRRSLLNHDIVMQGLIEANTEFGGSSLCGKLAGTSNVHLAHKYDLVPIGTIAHEWIMAVAALEGYEGSNGRAMDLWDITYPSGVLSIALTDTFSTKPFFDDFVSNPVRAKHWKGLRQDSGDPIAFLAAAKAAFEKVGADPKTKVIVFSDGLNSAKCLELKKASDVAGVGCSFGVGTFFTNDFQKVTAPSRMAPGEGNIREGGEKSKALNMVIKLYKIDDRYCVKISDEMSKNTGHPEAVREAKEKFGLPLEILAC